VQCNCNGKLKTERNLKTILNESFRLRENLCEKSGEKKKKKLQRSKLKVKSKMPTQTNDSHINMPILTKINAV